MNLYILTAGDLTSRYHPDGGLVVAATDLAAAKLRVAAAPDPTAYQYDDEEPTYLKQPTDEEWAKAAVIPIDPSFAPTVDTPTVWVFPDAGCC